jgi:hypothetical protein
MRVVTRKAVTKHFKVSEMEKFDGHPVLRRNKAQYRMQRKFELLVAALIFFSVTLPYMCRRNQKVLWQALIVTASPCTPLQILPVHPFQIMQNLVAIPDPPKVQMDTSFHSTAWLHDATVAGRSRLHTVSTMGATWRPLGNTA